MSTGWALSLERAAEDGENADFRLFVGTTGGGDRLAIAYDADRFDLVGGGSFELHAINVGGRVRAPLAVRLREKATSLRFVFVVNHLYRGSAECRHEQSRLLNEWAKTQTDPVIMVGDYNFDLDAADETKRDVASTI